MKLSVLDQSPISEGLTAKDALHQTIDLARHTEQLGYHRFWVAEHHNTNGLASTSPEVLISQIAQSTQKIRVGSGGVLLPQYSPYKVAENFRMLEAFYPGRIDLGLGRSPGGGPKTRMALTDGIEKPLSSFSRQVKELSQFLYGDFPKGDRYYGVKATPETVHQPELWVLGLSERGAKHAAINGTGFTFGHFINPDRGGASISTYKQRFKSSKGLQKPRINVCIFVICAETEEKAEELALSQDLWLLRVEKGLDTRVPSVDKARAYPYTEDEIKKISRNRRRCVIGDPHQVREQLLELSEMYKTEEFLIITNIFDFEEKKKSYERIADLF
ncbi:luciferase family oxidoreductase, group 1 [Halobacillus karajensis]|uniref:Limonene 1,2-monooxygenase n=1 Tax=Halobacillus karajensis TaxID=195088 RepID=A0A024P2B8_9BACI|nr:LLM class flavin-dependent oxidoreductase [Halobacillus karajensis]CDQ19589.1 Limonene 1,2-monooxygenase [Halobacillus karajensis]CDQ22051.1 Limonene 1,2-monooxygenase [Halobacillus karajensis]CDQ27892.1 Limonene 1,2-monooxygenase [Halobacillus karajensis]SEH79833.1 luciferase family oxidoreductase, group 1 [Halobacillus karajensis]